MIGVQVSLDVQDPYHIIMTGVAGLLAGGILPNILYIHTYIQKRTQRFRWAVVNIFQ